MQMTDKSKPSNLLLKVPCFKEIFKFIPLTEEEFKERMTNPALIADDELRWAIIELTIPE